MSPNGTSRHFAASRQCRCFRAEADIGLDFMSTRLNGKKADAYQQWAKIEEAKFGCLQQP